MKNHYNKAYYSWQKKSGELGALIDLWMFKKYIKKNHTVLDFGCGGGYILKQLQCKSKVGVEINEHAAGVAQEKGIKIYNSIDAIPSSEKFDVIISHHALEHVEDPAEVLKKLKKHLKENGKTIHVVPINDWRNDKTYDPKDINKHLYTWTPLLLGNLFTHTGYKIKQIEILTHAWLPLSKFYFSFTPKVMYHLGCAVWSFLTRNRQIKIVATVS